MKEEEKPDMGVASHLHLCMVGINAAHNGVGKH